MKNQLKKFALIAGLAALPAFSSFAQPYYIAGSGITPNWTTTEPGATPMSGGPSVYTVTLATLADTYHEFKAAESNWTASWPGNNAMVKGDANGTNTFYFYPGTVGDGWLPFANRVGFDDPGNMSWGFIGSFNGWGTDVPLNLQGAGVYTNTITVATAGTYEYKFRTPGTWSEVRFGVDMGTDSANGSFTTTNSPQDVPVVLDLPGGRWLVGDLSTPPPTNSVTFLVDMSIQALTGAFTNGMTVEVRGSFNNWSGGTTLTNDPGAANTNLYSTVVDLDQGSTVYYKFVYNNGSGDVWESSTPKTSTPDSGSPDYNRVLNVPATATHTLPASYFDDTRPSDYLAQDVTVRFSVNMAGTMSVSNVAYDPSFYGPPYINGNFLTNGWIGTWNPIELADYQMTEDPPGSTNYVFEYVVPKGKLVFLQYKYGFDDFVNSLDNEAGFGQNHERYVRTTATGSYTNAQDTFGNMYGEPSFGQLSIGAPSGGTVPVSWLGRPGVTLESTTDITGGWAEAVETDGTNWSAGVSSANGLMSVTNVPTSGTSQYFRLLRQ